TLLPGPDSVMPFRRKRLIARPPMIELPAVTVSPLALAPALLALSSTSGAPVQPGWLRASITTGSVIVGNAEAGAIEATPETNMLGYDAVRPGWAVPSASMNTALSLP